LMGMVSMCVVACSSSSTGSDACQIAGTYALLEKVDTSAENSCGATDDTSPSTITVGPDGAIVFQGVNGSCPGTINGCTLTAACDGTLTAGGTLTVQISWTFDDSGFHGSSAVGERPTGKARCESTLVDSATRK